MLARFVPIAEAVLPVREQVPRENIRSGDRVVAYVLDDGDLKAVLAWARRAMRMRS